MSKISDERREVAERLRFCARETNGTSDFSMYLGHWVNADDADEEQVGNPFTVQADRKSAERTLEKLADLIDPTCSVVRKQAYTGGPQMYKTLWCCSECGYPLAESKYKGHRPFVEEIFCPHCGSRVVSHDDN
jgi:DNA-directed RNA polymerase subunit RPC12/RpoP